MKKFINIALFLSLSILIYAQENKFTVEQFTIDGELTMEDIFQPDFGKFDPYEFYLNQGDRIRIELTAAFPPMLVIVSPSEQSKILYPENGNPTAIFDSEIRESGTWFVYVVGDSADTGAYQIFARYAAKDFITLEPNQDFCKNIDYIVTHARADFFFLQNRDIQKSPEGWESNTLINGAKSAMVIEEGKNKYSALMYRGDLKEEAELVYNYLSEKIKNCLSVWKTNEENSGDDRKLSFSILDESVTKNAELVMSSGSEYSVKIFIFRN